MPEICLSWIKTTHTMKRLFRYLGPVLLCFAVGFSASLFQARAIAEWYPALVKPPLTPPPPSPFPSLGASSISAWVSRSAWRSTGSAAS